MDKSLEYIMQFILAQKLSDSSRQTLLKHLQNVEEEVMSSYYQRQKADQEKNSLVNILNNTIEELESKNKLIEQQQFREEEAIFKEKLLTNISHELRTPLNAIIGMSHLLSNTHLDDRQQDFVDVIKTGASNLLNIINDLLELSSLKERKIKINKKPFSTEKLLSDLYNILWFRSRQKQLDLIFDSDEKLPEYLNGDQYRIHQILLNLLNNAIKFTHRGSITLKIKVMSQKNNKVYLEMAVIDTGIGIAKYKLLNIFDTFTQAHEDEGEVYSGTGTGLSIVKNLVEMMGGGISVRSELGKGSIMTVVMPFEIPDDKTLELYIAQKAISTVSGWHGKKILYIEDNDANILYLKNMLTDQPVEFDTAQDFVEADRLLTTKLYDCILSDVKLPDGNGIDFMASIRKDPEALNRKTPVVVITAGATDAERHKAQKIGIEGYIGKPFAPDTLFGELDRIFADEENIASLLSFYPYKSNKKEKITELAHLNRVMKGNKQAMIEMIDIFLKQLPDSTRKMETAVEKEDWQRVHFEAHKVKSTIGIIGLEKLENTILEINENTRERKDLAFVPSLFHHFKKQGEIEIRKLKEERRKLSIELKKS